MEQDFYGQPALYDLMFPDQPGVIAYYRFEAGRRGGAVLELGSGTGQKLIPMAADGHDCVGLDLSPVMLSEAERKAGEAGVRIHWTEGDMRDFDLGRRFDLIFVTGNSLLHLLEADDLVRCFRAVGRHLAPGGRLVMDIFNPSVDLLAEADGLRRRRQWLTFEAPDRGTVWVDVAERYDAARQVTRGRWWLSSPAEPDFLSFPLAIRSVFPQELPVLLELGGLRLAERYGDFASGPFTGDSPVQVCVCVAA